MIKTQLLIFLLTLVLTPSFCLSEAALASLPPGNAIKDPQTILREALPIEEQKNIRKLQRNIESTNALLREKRWNQIKEVATSSQFILNTNKSKLLNNLNDNDNNKASLIIEELSQDLHKLENEAILENKNNIQFTYIKALKRIDSLEGILTADFPFYIPEKYDKLPRLLGRATVAIKTSKGDLTAVIDGFSAPLTGGAFIDLVQKRFYDKLPFTRAEDFYVLQTGDPKGEDTGYRNPETGEIRNVPLEIRVEGKPEIFYGETFEDLGFYKDAPVLPFSTLGTLGWAHSDQNLNDGSSQFFIFLYEAELTPAGRNLVDGRNAAFGYVIEGSEIIKDLKTNDQIISIEVIDGANLLKSHA